MTSVAICDSAWPSHRSYRYNFDCVTARRGAHSYALCTTISHVVSKEAQAIIMRIRVLMDDMVEMLESLNDVN